MKIAMLGVKAVPAIGGIAYYIEQVGSRLVDRGHKVTVYCRPHYLESQGDYMGMERVVTRGVRGKHLDTFSHTVTSLWHALRDDFDLFHIHGCGPGVFTPLLRLLGGRPVVVTLHGIDWQRSKWGPVASWMMMHGSRVPARWADGLTAVSTVVRDIFEDHFARRAVVVPTGIDVPEIVEANELHSLGIEPFGYVFCAVRLVPEKGIHYLIDAFEQIESDKSLVIAGSCPEDDPYVDELRSHASDRIRFVGYVTGRLLDELFSNAYVYVQPSELEGLSISVLRALSCGRCLLVSDIPENVEALGNCGYTFRSKDVRDLRQKLEFLLENPEAVQDEFEKARKYISHERSWETTVDDFEELYCQLLNGG